MTDNLIQFHAIEKDWIPAPYPAIKSVPGWFKNLPASVQLPGVRGKLHTVKQCPPFLDAMTAGYIIPLCGDVDFSLSQSGELSYECPNGDVSVEMHDREQVAGSPWGDSPVVKFMNPWIIVTPPGYSTLYLPPLNQEVAAFEILSGIVDTDTFYATVNFPAVCRMARGSSCMLKRETPLVQVIPFKREAWQMQTGHADAKRLEDFARDLAHSHHVYREQNHQKKSFS